jgi:hypothetical protein
MTLKHDNNAVNHLVRSVRAGGARLVLHVGHLDSPAGRVVRQSHNWRLTRGRGEQRGTKRLLVPVAQGGHGRTWLGDAGIARHAYLDSSVGRVGDRERAGEDAL